jgi:hypothetical protein
LESDLGVWVSLRSLERSGSTPFHRQYLHSTMMGMTEASDSCVEDQGVYMGRMVRLDEVVANCNGPVNRHEAVVRLDHPNSPENQKPLPVLQIPYRHKPSFHPPLPP